MSKDFSQMTAAELREYAETVQAEYDADELSGPSGRQIVRDAWERVAEAERAEAEAVYTAPDAAPELGFSVKIRTNDELAQIAVAERIATNIAKALTDDELAELIQHHDKMAKEIDNDLAIALALTYQKILASRKAPRDTTPISAEQWEAMHGIGVEPVQDERPVMMIRRAIIEDTAGYVGRTAFDSVHVWRLYGTPNGEIWGAQWRHFKTAHGNVVDWRETTWGTMQHIRQFIDATAELNDVVAEWERY